MDPKKVSSIVDWPIPASVRDFQFFVGFCNYYRRFIPRFSALLRPLTALTRKDTPFVWNPELEACFSKVKSVFLTNPILIMPNQAEPFVLETDASEVGCGAVLSQYRLKELRPVAFYSAVWSAAELNYDVHDKELLAVIKALKEWRHLLCEAKYPVTVYTDHKNLTYFLTSRSLNRRQARWSQFLADYDLKFVYRPGPENVVADALSRHSGPIEEEGVYPPLI